MDINTDGKVPITAVIVTYQSEATISRALEAARRCYDARLLEVVIVDNKSTDRTRELIQNVADWGRVILSEKNNGFGRACNIGLANINTRYTIFINPDALVEPDAIRSMLQFMEHHPKVGIVGPAIIQGDFDSGNVLQQTGLCPTPWTMLLRQVPFLKVSPMLWPIIPGASPTKTGWMCGAVLLVRTKMVKDLNGFDPRFFLYWEETDLCKRAESMGFETWAVGSAVARHIGGASSSDVEHRVSGCIARYYYQSRYYYMVKHHGQLAAMFAEIGEFVLLGLRSLVNYLRGRRVYPIRPRLQARLLSQPEE